MSNLALYLLGIIPCMAFIGYLEWNDTVKGLTSKDIFLIVAISPLWPLILPIAICFFIKEKFEDWEVMHNFNHKVIIKKYTEAEKQARRQQKFKEDIDKVLK